MCLSALITILLSVLLITVVYYGDFESRMKTEVRTETGYLQAALNASGDEYLQSLQDVPQNRITLIAPDGSVRYDNQADETSLENHGGRPEVKAALSGGAGESTRISDTISKQTYYYAVRLENGDVLRVASTTDTVFSAILGLLPWLLLVAVAVAAATALLAGFLTKRIVAPINSLDLEHPGDNACYDEISPLLSKINRQGETIARQIQSLQEKQEEFSFITENMSEGFLVIDRATEILSYNTSALRLLGGEGAGEAALPVPRPHSSALTLNRSESFREAVDSALSGRRSEQLLRFDGGRCCQLMANPVERDGDLVGAVLVVLDVTEREERENLRREFTANVSHELKTPLTSISGFAEIIRGGIAKPADIPHFAGNIYQESQRLIALVDDILNLSRLDEADGNLERSRFDLTLLARGVAERLKRNAQEQGVALIVDGVEGGTAEIEGVRSVVDEMIYNLCDNAVKYNRKNGRVTVKVEPVPEGVRLSVADTGIGIPAADRDRVFERFYRVDKSHSKEIGGTGLGLSIVKHAAAYHHAALSLESAEGKGTTVTVVFPK